MKKPFEHTDLSDDRVCVACGKPLKLSVLARKPRATHCYACGAALRKKHGKVAD